MSAWYNFYVARMNDAYYDHVFRKYLQFINQIAMRCLPGDIVVEAGCGTANITRALKELRPESKYIVVDNDDKMLGLAASNLREWPSIAARQLDIRYDEMPKADIVHGHGVLEHFDDETIRQIIGLQISSGARFVAHYVPSAKYKKPSFGDERLMTPELWKEICAPTEIYEFNDGYDLVLMWKVR